MRIAVWLNPKSEWEYKYAYWEAIEKLEFVNEVMNKLPQQRCFNKEEVTSISEDTRTLREYYRDKRRDLRLNKRRPVIQKIDTEFLPYVVNNKKEVRKILLKQKGVNSYIVDKFLKDVGNECKSKKIQLNYNSQVSIAILEEQLQAATQEYLKQGRHRIVM